MHLTFLSLRNIRSYTQLDLELPEGIILLSGDIGSGKTTLLLAVEFALFGVLRGDMQASMLLRYGATNGEIILGFVIGSSAYKIGRSLKRCGEDIRQDKCWLESSQGLKECTPVELKAEVLTLMGYSLSLVNKSKSLIYRYTIYTPQEHMKKILEEDASFRLGIVRSLFDIDKYERIRTSCELYLRHLRTFIGTKEESLKRLQLLRAQYDALVIQQASLKSAITSHQRTIAELEQTQSAFKERLSKLEHEQMHYREDLLRYEHIKRSLDQHNHALAVSARQLNFVNQHLSQLSITEPSLPAEQQILEEKEMTQNKMEALKRKEEQNILRRSEAQAQLTLIKQFEQTILTKDFCPTCQQKISPEHISNIRAQQQKTAMQADLTIKSADDLLQQIRSTYSQSQKIIDALIQKIHNIKQEKQTAATISTLLNQQNELVTQMEETKLVMINTKQELETLKNRLAGQSSLDKTYNENRLEHERITKNVEDQRKELWGSTAQLDFLIQQGTTLESEINELITLHLLIQEKRKIMSWISSFFIPLQHTLETQQLLRLHHQFENSFSRWYSLLMEGHETDARVDEAFSPIISQAGHSCDIANLSGGEKTSVALAYRLALNDLITHHHDRLQARGMLILDEPTDGFSSEQFARLGEILSQLNLPQIILVSHEAQLEGFVQYTFSVEKISGKSRVTRLT